MSDAGWNEVLNIKWDVRRKNGMTEDKSRMSDD